MEKRTVIKATDPIVSRKVANPDLRDRGASAVFTSGVKTLTATTAVAVVVSVFVPVVLGVAIFTGLLTVVAFVMVFVSTLKFENQYDARQSLDDSPLHNSLSIIDGRTNPISPFYVLHPDTFSW